MIYSHGEVTHHNRMFPWGLILVSALPLHRPRLRPEIYSFEAVQKSHDKYFWLPCNTDSGIAINHETLANGRSHLGPIWDLHES